MKVWFIGAGPGAADLVTVRGRDRLGRCPVVLYAGSLVPPEVLAWAPEGARLVDTAPLHLEQIVQEFESARRAGLDVARLQSGDPSLYGALAEQMRRLDALGIEYEVIPGVPAYAAAAAVLERELTLPGVSQTVVLTRTSVRSSPMPEGEELPELARLGATLALHLSILNLDRVVEALVPHYGEDCPVAVVYRVTWPDQRILRGTLADIRSQVRSARLTRTCLILVGRVLDPPAFADSRLYAPDHRHVLRPEASA